MDNIPSEVAGLIKKHLGELEEAVELVEETYQRLEEKNVEIKLQANSIDRVRQKMNHIDQVLADAHAILVGYSDALEQLENPPPTMDSSDVLEEPDV